MKFEERKKFFEDGPGRRIFGHGTLVLFFEDIPATGQALPHIVVVGEVVDRKGIFKTVSVGPPEENCFVEVLQFGVSVKQQTMGTWSSLLKGTRKTSRGGLQRLSGVNLHLSVFSASAGFFSVEPVLERLQDMDSIHMADVIVHYKPTSSPELPHAGKHLSDYPDIQMAVQADPSQAAAMELLFQSKVVLVQGPPGTGKTYLGVQMVKTLLKRHRRESGPILCLCYTNHALDSFLLELIANGVPKEEFVRLGRSPKINSAIEDRASTNWRTQSLIEGKLTSIVC